MTTAPERVESEASPRDPSPPASTTEPRTGLWASAIACAPLLVLALLVFPRFDGLYGQDSFAYRTLASSLANPETRHEALASRTSPGYPMVMALAPGPESRAGQWVSLASAVLLVLGCTALLAEIEPGVEWSGYLAAGLVIACSGLVWQLAVSVMSDLWTMALVVWGLVLWIRSTRSGRTWRVQLTAGALLLGLAVIARPAALVFVPIAGLLELAAWRGESVWRRFSRLAIAALVMVPQWTVWMLGPGAVAVMQHSFLTDWSLGHVVGLGEAADQRGWGGVLRSSMLFYVLGAGHPEIFGVFAALIPLGLIRVLRSRRSWSSLVVVVIWPALVALFLAGFSMRNTRFALMLVVPLAILVALGVQWLLARATFRRSWLAAGVLLGVCVQMVGGVDRVSQFLSMKDQDLAAVRHADEWLKAGDAIVAFDLTATADHYTDREVIELYDVERTRWARVLAEPETHHVLVDREDVAKRWNDQQIARDLAKLEETGWAPVHQTGRWTLLSHQSHEDGESEDGKRPGVDHDREDHDREDRGRDGS